MNMNVGHYFKSFGEQMRKLKNDMIFYFIVAYVKRMRALSQTIYSLFYFFVIFMYVLSFSLKPNSIPDMIFLLFYVVECSIIYLWLRQRISKMLIL